MTRSAVPSSTGAMSDGRAAGSWLKSASIWTTTDAPLECDREPVQVGPPETLLRRPMSDADAFVGRGQLVGDAAGPVRRTVVDHEQHGAGDRCEDRLGDRPDVVGLVVGRQDDPRPGPRGVLVGHGRQCSGALGGQWAWTTTVRAYHVVPTQLRAQTTTLYVLGATYVPADDRPSQFQAWTPAPNERSVQTVRTSEVPR